MEKLERTKMHRHANASAFHMGQNYGTNLEYVYHNLHAINDEKKNSRRKCYSDSNLYTKHRLQSESIVCLNWGPIS